MPFPKEHGRNILFNGEKADEIGLVNQYGLSRKVCHGPRNVHAAQKAMSQSVHVGHLLGCQSQLGETSSGLH